MQSWLAISVFALYVLIPFFSLVKLMLNFEKVKLNQKSEMANFNSLFKGLNDKNGRKVLLEPIMYLVRRIFLVIMIINGLKIFIW